MRRMVIVVLSLLVVWLCSGCSIDLIGEGEFGFRQSTQWALYHEAQPTIERMSKSEIHSQPLEEWFDARLEGPAEVNTTGVPTRKVVAALGEQEPVTSNP